jgi:hypothetical protein
MIRKVEIYKVYNKLYPILCMNVKLAVSHQGKEGHNFNVPEDMRRMFGRTTNEVRVDRETCMIRNFALYRTLFEVIKSRRIR